jgi:multiple antibiotic resistance protein
MPGFETILHTVVTLFVTIDPIGAAPLFLILTKDMDRLTRLRVARRAGIAAVLILLVFALGGNAILKLFSITIPAFRVAGGLLLFWTAFEMIYELRKRQREKISEEAVHDHVQDVALFPLAIPILAGPGTISATILLSQRLYDPLSRLVLVGAIFFTLIATYFLFCIAESLDAYLNPGIRTVLTRLLGLILAALSVQIIADGIKALGGF